MGDYTSIDSANHSIQSKVISFLRFPLIVAVILIHTEPHTLITEPLKYNTIYEIIYYFLSETVAGAAVPIFFMFSGFLFFNKSTFTPNIYINKLKNRAKTILLPYISWNIIVYLVFLLNHFIFSTNTSDDSIVTNITGIDWLRIFWDIRSDFYPLCAQFWFLRDLMVIMVLSPIIYFSIKIFNYYIILIWGILWSTNLWFDIIGLSITSIFFFSVGAYFGINKKNFIKTFKPLLKPSIILYPIICIILLSLRDTFWAHYIRSFCILIEIILCIDISALYISKNIWRTNNSLSGSSFFIYAYHQVFLAVIVKILVITVSPKSGFCLLIIYLLSALSIILFGLMLYYLLQRFCPKITTILTGGR